MSTNPAISHPARLGSSVRAMVLVSVLGFTLMTGCSDTTPPAPSSTSESVSPGETSSNASANSPVSATGSDGPDGNTDTAGWKSFSTNGLSFKHPADWEIKAHPCHGCRQREERYTTWGIHIPRDQVIAQFRVDLKDDTDRRKGLHTRTILERTPMDPWFSQPAEVVFDHKAIDVTGKKQQQKVLLMLNDTASTNRRHERPMWSVIYSRDDFTSRMFSTEAFPKMLGYDQDHVSLEDARKIMQSNEYRQLRTLMPSERTET